MKNTILLFFLLSGMLVSCNNDNTKLLPDETQPVELPINGRYIWEFHIPEVNADQISIHDFSNEVIKYEMAGSAYTNSYEMKPVYYSETEGRLVAVGKGGSGGYSKDGVYFVLFIKDITEESIVLYKKECSSREEAYSFAKPADGDLTNHGWNVYAKE